MTLPVEAIVRGELLLLIFFPSLFPYENYVNKEKISYFQRIFLHNMFFRVLQMLSDNWVT